MDLLCPGEIPIELARGLCGTRERERERERERGMGSGLIYVETNLNLLSAAGFD